MARERHFGQELSAAFTPAQLIRVAGSTQQLNQDWEVFGVKKTGAVEEGSRTGCGTIIRRWTEHRGLAS